LVERVVRNDEVSGSIPLSSTRPAPIRVLAPTKVFFDGGARPNPGPIEAAVVMRGKTFFGSNLGAGSNVEAEWAALIFALEVSRAVGLQDIILIGDCAIVIEQARGRARCRSASLQSAFETYTAHVQAFQRVRMRLVGRAQNLAGIALEKNRWRP